MTLEEYKLKCKDLENKFIEFRSKCQTLQNNYNEVFNTNLELQEKLVGQKERCKQLKLNLKKKDLIIKHLDSLIVKISKGEAK